MAISPPINKYLAQLETSKVNVPMLTRLRASAEKNILINRSFQPEAR